MKKNLLTVLIAISCMVTTAVAAAPRECSPGCRPCPPPPHPCRPCRPGCGWGLTCSRDLGNAAAITSIVANSVSILGTLSYPRTVVTQPVYQTPVYTPPVYTPAPVVVPVGPLPPGLIVGTGCPAVRYGGYLWY